MEERAKKIENTVLDFRTMKENSLSRSKNSTVYCKRNEGRNSTMDDLLKTYIEKVDRDQNALRQDIRESEKRVNQSVEAYEARMDQRLDRIEGLITEQNKKLDDIKDEVNRKMDDNRKFMWGIVITIILSIVASIGVIISTYQSTIGLIEQFIK